MNTQKLRIGAASLFLTFSLVAAVKAQSLSVVDTVFGSLAADAAGNLYSSQFSTIVKRSPSGTVTVIAGTGTVGFSGDGGPATSAQIACTNLTISGGSVYFSDTSHRVRKISPSGIITTIAGTGVGGYSGDGGAATAAQIWPSAIGADPAGNIYFASGGRIRKVTTAGIISTIAGTGTFGNSGDGGPASAAQIDADIRAIVADAPGNIYFTGTTYSRVRKVSASGTITTMAGTGTTGFSGDGGAATSATLGMPIGLAMDVMGNFYLADLVNNRIRKINTSGIISTIAGTGAGTCSLGGGVPTAAAIWAPSEVAVDAAGNIYFESGECGSLYKISSSASTVADVNTERAITILPTMNTGTFTIKGSAANGSYQLTIANLQGQTVYQKGINVSNNAIAETVTLPENLPNVYD